MWGWGVLSGYCLGEEGGAAPPAGRPRLTAPSSPDELALLPNAPGKEVTVRVCTSCHRAEIWSHSRLSQTAWDEVMRRMMTVRGMTLTANEYETVLDYLSNHLGLKQCNRIRQSGPEFTLEA